MKSIAGIIAMLTAFSNAIEASTEQISSQLEQIKIELSQTEYAHLVPHPVLGWCGETDAPSCHHD